MIKGVHTMFYSSEPEALRAFFKDVFGWSHTDVGGGWLIFELPPADLGVHPTEGAPPSGTADISFFCDDLAATMAEMTAKGVQFLAPVEDHGYALVTFFAAPGGLKLQLYQPHYRKG